MTESGPANAAVLTVLKNSPSFRGLDRKVLLELALVCLTQEYKTGELVFQRDSPGEYLYGVIAGSLRMQVHSSDGRELALSTTGPGEIGGEIAALDGGTRTATALALTATTLFIIPRESFLEVMQRHPSLNRRMIEMLCARVRQTSQQVEDAVFLTVPQKLARQLQILVAASGNELPCKLKISQSELAAFLNASRQVVNGCLQTWQKLGFVKLGRGSIEIIDIDAVQARAIDS